MFKHTKMFVPAVLAAGTLLLTACDLGASADDGPTMLLVPDKGELGYLTCDQVYSVWDKFTDIDAQTEIPAEGISVDGDWQCVPRVDNGETVGADCFTPAVPDADNPIQYQFHAEPKA